MINKYCNNLKQELIMNSYFKTSRDINQLYSLSERERNDIGITLGDIMRIEQENSLFKRFKDLFFRKSNSSDNSSTSNSKDLMPC